MGIQLLQSTLMVRFSNLLLASMAWTRQLAFLKGYLETLESLCDQVLLEVVSYTAYMGA
jgi:hypothetical protein